MQVALSYQTWQELKEALQQKVMEGLQSMETATDYFSVLTPFLWNLWRHIHTCMHTSLSPPLSVYKVCIVCLNIRKVQQSHSNPRWPPPALQQREYRLSVLRRQITHLHVIHFLGLPAPAWQSAREVGVPEKDFSTSIATSAWTHRAPKAHCSQEMCHLESLPT